MKFFHYPIALALLVALFATPTTHAVDIVWDGGNGSWNLPSANWNGGQQSTTVFGSFQGLENVSSAVGSDVFINSGNVTYDPNTFGDFHFTQQVGAAPPGDYDSDGDVDGNDLLSWQRGVSTNNGSPADLTTWENNYGAGGAGGALGTLNITGGATWSHNSASDVDGKWTTMDAAELNIDGAGSKLIRTKSGPSQSGGSFILGSWKINSITHPVININLTNGGTIENDGQVWFGALNDSAPDQEVNVNINGGHLDLTGGTFGLNQTPATTMTSDMLFVHNSDVGNLDETYTINFTGPGSIIVDRAGIAILEQNIFGGTDGTEAIKKTYQDLWTEGILQVNGTNDGLISTFNANFTVTGTTGTTGGVEDDDYTLTSLVVSPGVGGGGGGAGFSASFGGVPEPTSIMLVTIASLTAFATTRRRWA